MKHKLIFGLLVTLFFNTTAGAQQLPNGFTDQEWLLVKSGEVTPGVLPNGIITPPVGSYLRSAAEWEEIQCLTIAWTGYTNILKAIVAAAKLETRVIILSEDVQATQDYLLSNQGGTALPDLNNVTILSCNFDSIWMRDYAGNTVYKNEVDSLVLVDWIYNRPTRPNDDASPECIAAELNIPLHTMTIAPNDLVNTGGNWMGDGLGTAFASELILEENIAGNPYGVSAKTESQIDGIVQNYLGIDRYIKMNTLPYDGIHHIDMHMKLLDEETLLVGEYPNGVSDGPQINANIEYVLSNYNSVWGTPYHIVRIPMPSSATGGWPSTGSSYRTFTNAVFVNKTIILPTYREQVDTTALRIWEESMPGYNIVGIDCDNNTSNIISQSGAIHCITHSVGVEDPMLITHQSLQDTDNDQEAYGVTAYIKHRSGISSAQLYWRLFGNTIYNVVDMVNIGNGNWQGFIPAQAMGSTVQYYVQGEAVSGKVQVRPITAPAGYWDFSIVGVNAIANISPVLETKLFPNPASAITCLRWNAPFTSEYQVDLLDMTGRKVSSLFNGTAAIGEKQIFFNANEHPAGVYLVQIKHQYGVQTIHFCIQ
jgi:agmatine deiminase